MVGALVQSKHLPVILGICGAFFFIIWFKTYGDGRGMYRTSGAQGRDVTWQEGVVIVLVCIFAPRVVGRIKMARKRHGTEKERRRI